MRYTVVRVVGPRVCSVVTVVCAVLHVSCMYVELHKDDEHDEHHAMASNAHAHEGQCKRFLLTGERGGTPVLSCTRVCLQEQVKGIVYIGPL